MACTLITELQMEFQASDVSFYNGNKKCLLEHQLFTRIFAFKLFHVSTVVAHSISSKYYLQFLSNYLYHKLAKFEEKKYRMILTTQNFDIFDKNLYIMMLITSERSLAPL